MEATSNYLLTIRDGIAKYNLVKAVIHKYLENKNTLKKYSK